MEAVRGRVFKVTLAVDLIASSIADSQPLPHERRRRARRPLARSSPA